MFTGTPPVDAMIWVDAIVGDGVGASVVGVGVAADAAIGASVGGTAATSLSFPVT